MKVRTFLADFRSQITIYLFLCVGKIFLTQLQRNKTVQHNSLIGLFRKCVGEKMVFHCAIRKQTSYALIQLEQVTYYRTVCIFGRQFTKSIVTILIFIVVQQVYLLLYISEKFHPYSYLHVRARARKRLKSDSHIIGRLELFSDYISLLPVAKTAILIHS